MTIKDKIIMAILTILTLGIYPLVVFNRKATSTPKKELSVNDKITVNSSALILALGGEANMSSTEYTHTKVKIFIKDKTKVNVEKVRAVKGVSGVFASSHYVTIIVGNQAKNLAELITK